MKYNVSYDIATVILSIVLTIIHGHFYGRDDENKRFQRFIGFVGLAAILDIITALGIDHTVHFSDNVSLLLNEAYFCVSTFASYSGYILMEKKLKYTSKSVQIINTSVLTLAILTQTVNTFTGIVFYFADGVYTKSSLFYSNYAFPMFFVLQIFNILIKKREELDSSKFLVIISFLGFPIIAVLLQILFPSVLLTSAACIIPGLIFCFALETPTYIKLQATIDELEKSHENEAINRREAEKSNASMTSFLESLSNELRIPINNLLNFDEFILAMDIPESAREAAIKIGNAGHNLLSLVNDLHDYARIETGNIVGHPVEYMVVQVHSDYLSDDIKQLEKNGIKFIYTIDPTIPQRLYGNINRVHQIINNLLIYSKGRITGTDIDFNIQNTGIKGNQVNLRYNFRIKNLVLNASELEKFTLNSLEPLADTNHEHALSIPIAKKLLESMGSNLFISSDPSGTTFCFMISQQIIDAKEVGNIEQALNYYQDHKDLYQIIDSLNSPMETLVVTDARS